MPDTRNAVETHPEWTPTEVDGDFGSFIVDGRGIVLGLDDRIEALTGWPAVKVVGRHKDVANPIPGEDSESRVLSSPLYEGRIAIPQVSAEIELRLQCCDGRILDVEAVAARVTGTGDRATVTVRRILARSETAAERRELGSTDALTGLLDGQGFSSALAGDFREATAAGRPVTIVLADIDHMRRVNDQIGRQSGDEVIRKLSGILRATAGAGDLVARVGEDEFALALIGKSRREAREIAGRLRATVERFRFFDIRFGKDPVTVTLSLGSASSPADAETDTMLLDRAREALGEAQAHGRNRVWCYTRRPRVRVRTPVFLDGAEPLLVGITRDLSPSGIFVQTPSPLEAGMRCALAFPLPGWDGNVHVVGRVVRSIPPRSVDEFRAGPPAGMAIEFERFGPEDRTAIDCFLHGNEALVVREEMA